MCFQAIVRLSDDSERLHMLQAVYDTYDLQPVPAAELSDAPETNSCRFVFIGELKKSDLNSFLVSNLGLKITTDDILSKFLA